MRKAPTYQSVAGQNRMRALNNQKRPYGCEKSCERTKAEGDLCHTSNSYGIENAPSLAMVYSPIQEWCELYDLTEALERGTLFKELDKPFNPKEKCGGGRYGR